MCLYTKQICPIKARKDIEVYKVLRYVPEKHKIVTPYIGFPILTKTMDVSGEPVKHGHCFLHSIWKGMIHSYRNFYTQDDKWWFVVKAIIPKGTLYYKGLGGQYASKKLILKEIVLYPIFNTRKDLPQFKRAYKNLSES